MLKAQGYSFKERDALPHLPRRLVTNVVNSLMTFIIFVAKNKPYHPQGPYHELVDTKNPPFGRFQMDLTRSFNKATPSPFLFSLFLKIYLDRFVLIITRKAFTHLCCA